MKVDEVDIIRQFAKTLSRFDIVRFGLDDNYELDRSVVVLFIDLQQYWVVNDEYKEED